jgi:hypothetical protein
MVERKEISIVGTQPGKYPPKHIGANILWLFQVYLKKLERPIEVIHDNTEEYEVLIESLTEGFI